MKTTIDISDPILEQAKAVAAREGTTVKSLVELGLRHVLAERETPVSFHLRDASFGGDGLRSELRAASWDRIRDLAYGDGS